MRMKNETALITGSTRGIGKKIAELLLREGCRVTICSRNQDRVRETLSEFEKQFGDHVMGAVCDVSRLDDIKKIVGDTVSRFGSIRIVIANAGVSPIYGPFEFLSEEQIVDFSRYIIDTNLIGTINTVAAVLPQMKKQSYGRIITLSGGGDSRPVQNFSLYAASKGGISSFSKCLNVELKNSNPDIKINIFQPGPMKTNLNEKLHLVSGWKDEKTFQTNWKNLFDKVDLDIEECCRKVLPYILPGCKTTGKVIMGFSLMKMLPKIIKIQKAMKEL